MAGRISEQIVEQIRERTDIVDVIGSRVELRRAGSDYMARCPFHNEKTPSFHVNPSRQSYKCFGCGEGGDVFSFLMKHDGMTFMDAVRMLADRCGISIAVEKDDGSGAKRKRLLEINAGAAAFYMRCLKKMDEAQVARDYLASRDLGEDVVEAFQIGYAPRAEGTLLKFAKKYNYTLDEMVEAGLLSLTERYGRNHYHDRFRGRLMFTICDSQGRAVAFSGRILEKNDKLSKYVNSPETPIFQKSSILYGLHKAQRAIASAVNRRAIICEGQIDTIRCHAAGFATAVASQGTAFTEEHVRLLKRYADSVVMVFDRDKAGLKATKRTARLFLAAGVPVRAASLPEGEDPDSFIRTRGAEAFGKILEAGEEIIPYQYRMECAAEEDAGSADAAGRIAHELLETVVQCSNAVHRARMVQQAAELLKLPVEALEAELGVAEEHKKRQDDRAAALEKARESDHAQQVATDEINTLLVPEEEFLGMDPMDLGIEVEGAAAPLPSMMVPAPAERGLCELLLQRVEEPEFIRFVSTYMPEELFQHPYCRAVVHAIYLMGETGGQSLVDVQQTPDEELTAFVGRLATAPERLLFGDGGPDELSPAQQAVTDFIQSLWKSRLQRERDSVADRPGDDAEALREKQLQRQRLTLDLMKLNRWESAEPIILKRCLEQKA